MKYISIFSGIEAASVAFEPLGWEPIAFSEVDQFPCAVLKEHYPDVPNLGDIREVDWSPYRGAVDIVVGGSPCQSFSIAAAANRNSLDGESRLMFEYLRCIDEVRPRWVIWENVPGVFSTRDNAFGLLLDTLGEIGYQDISYRVLDAQFFGVAQRRRRVYVVGHLGGRGFRSAAVLFEQGCVSGHHPSSREKRQSIARTIALDAGGDSEPIAFDTTQLTSATNRSNPQSGDPCHTFTRHTDAPSICVQGSGDRHGVICMTDTQGKTAIGDIPHLTRHSSQDAPVVCVADDNGRAAVDVDICGSLKRGGGQPWIAKSSALCRRPTARE